MFSCKCGQTSSVVSTLASGARGSRFDPRSQRGKFQCSNTLSLVPFAGMTLDKCIFRRIWTITGCPLSTERCPLCRLKNPAEARVRQKGVIVNAEKYF